MHSARIELPQSTRWDRVGVIGSLLCIGHCIATPFLAALLPVLAVTEKGTHIGFVSTDVRADYARLKGQGVTFFGEPVEFRPGVWVVYFYGPDGEVCELRQS